MKEAINKILSEYAVPLWVFMVAISIMVGLIKNWEGINDAQAEGRRKEAMWNIFYYAAYPAIGMAVLMAIVAIVQETKIQLK